MTILPRSTIGDASTTCTGEAGQAIAGHPSRMLPRASAWRALQRVQKAQTRLANDGVGRAQPHLSSSHRPTADDITGDITPAERHLGDAA